MRNFSRFSSSPYLGTLARARTRRRRSPPRRLPQRRRRRRRMMRIVMTSKGASRAGLHGQLGFENDHITMSLTSTVLRG
jgi:hypothetical protein